MSYALGTCPTCGMAGYLTKAGLVRKHDRKDPGLRRYERETCAGTGQPSGSSMPRRRPDDLP